MFAIETYKLYKEFYGHKGFLEAMLHPFRKGEKKIVLDDINLSVKRGELFCLLGPNGAGKTTLIKILCTLIMPTAGSALINGYDVVKEPARVREIIGMISSEERSFFWRLSGLENLRFFSALYNIPPSSVHKEIDRVIDIAGIDEPEKRFQEYSAGTRQRLGIARALLKEPEILFMDEPTKSLDPIASPGMRRFIKDILVKRHKKTVLFTTHQLKEAEDMADRMAVLSNGHVKAIGSLEELKSKTDHKGKSIEELFSYYVKK